MSVSCELPSPKLNARQMGARCLSVLTDDALFDSVGVRIAFTGRAGGVSKGCFGSLNLGSHVQDDLACVEKNREILLESLGGQGISLIVPHQVHGDSLVNVMNSDALTIERVQQQVAQGADAVLVSASEVAALLCFADCVPVVVVSPTGRFAVVHAGWRGVVSGIASKAVRELSRLDQAELGGQAVGRYNIYIGPHIRGECFETGEEVSRQFSQLFGKECLADSRHVDLAHALTVGLVEAGVSVSRIADAGICSACSHEQYFSYRAQGGVCGRHGALAFRKAR